MEHLRSIAIKFVIYAAVLTIVLSLFFQVPVFMALITALIVTVLAYLIGDLWLLPNYGNTVSSIANAVIAGVATWLVFWALFPPVPNMLAVVAVAVIIGLADFFFHQYLKDTLLRENKTPQETE